MEVLKEKKQNTMLDNVIEQFNTISDIMDLNPNIRKILSITNNEIIIRFNDLLTANLI